MQRVSPLLALAEVGCSGVQCPPSEQIGCVTKGTVFEICPIRHRFPVIVFYDPQGPQDPTRGSFRVLRGGSWGNRSRDSRSAYRFSLDADYRSVSNGFRLVHELDDSAKSAPPTPPLPTETKPPGGTPKGHGGISAADFLPPAKGGTKKVKNQDTVKIKDNVVTAETAQDAFNAAMSANIASLSSQEGSGGDLLDIGFGWIEFGSGVGLIASGMDTYTEDPDPNASRLAQSQLIQPTFLCALETPRGISSVSLLAFTATKKKQIR